MINRRDEIFNILIGKDGVVAAHLGYVNYYLGGNINKVGEKLMNFLLVQLFELLVGGSL